MKSESTDTIEMLGNGSERILTSLECVLPTRAMKIWRDFEKGLVSYNMLTFARIQQPVNPFSCAVAWNCFRMENK